MEELEQQSVETNEKTNQSPSKTNLNQHHELQSLQQIILFFDINCSVVVTPSIEWEKYF